MSPTEIAQLQAREAAHWKTLRECADILCLPDESPSLLPEKIRLMQACALSEKQAKVERGDQVIVLQGLLQQMLDVAENCDETGYAEGVGFVDLDKLHNEVRAALKK